MANIFRQRVTWTGFPGGPGLSTLYFSGSSVNQAAVHDFFAGAATLIPSNVTITLQPGGDVIEDTTGVLTGSWAGVVTAPIPGAWTGAKYAAPVGALVRWETATVRNGSRLRGRTYLVPVANSVFDVDGTMVSGNQTDLANAANTFVGAVTPTLLVWQRPRAAHAAYTDVKGRQHPAVGARSGSTGVVIGSSVPDMAVVLRSRRD